MTTDEDRIRRLLRAATPDLDGLAPAAVARGPAFPRAALLVAAAVAAIVAAAVVVVAVRPGGGHNGAAATRSSSTVSPVPTSSTVPLAVAERLARRSACEFRYGLKAPGLRRLDTATLDQLRRFRPVAAVSCTSAERDYPDGQWLVMLQQVSIDPLGPLVAALEEPAAPQPSGNYACASYADGPPDVALVDAVGHFLRPTFPRDSCGHYRTSNAAHLADTLTAHTVQVQKIQLDVPKDPVKRACQTGWKNMIDVETPYAKLAPGRSTGGPGGRAIVCIYHRSKDPVAGEYVRGSSLDTTTTARLDTALSGAGKDESCPSQRDFAVLHQETTITYVELGGCWRVLRNDNTLGRADPSQVRAVLNN